MTDPKPQYGQPVEEPEAVDDVVGRAHEGLADAEAAGRDAVDVPPRPADPAIPAAETAGAAEATETAETAHPADSPIPKDRVEPASRVEPAAADLPDERVEPVTADAAAPAPASAYVDADSARPDDIDDSTRPDDVVAAPARSDVPAETYDGRAVEAEEPASWTTDRAETVGAEPVDEVAVAPVVAGAAGSYAAQPIFVQAPEPPRLRGNRGAAGAIGLLAAVCFGILYLGAWVALGLIDGFITGSNLLDNVVGALGTWSFWLPVAVFFVAFWLLGAVINRGRWGAWVVFGLLVGLASYAGHILGQLFQAPFWQLTSREGTQLVEAELLAPLAIAAFVIGRELTIWFGAWVAARGRRVTELNVEARREYERTLEAGPQLSRP